MLKTPKNSLNLAWGGIWGFSRNFFPSPPPSDFVPDGDRRGRKNVSPPPIKNLEKKPWRGRLPLAGIRHAPVNRFRLYTECPPCHNFTPNDPIFCCCSGFDQNFPTKSSNFCNQLTVLTVSDIVFKTNRPSSIQ